MSFSLIIASLGAGIFSVLAPCVLPLLPAMLAPSAQQKKHQRSVIWLLTGLGVSVLLFSILLKSTTALLDVPSSFWSIISGLIIMLFGVSLVAPSLWDWVMIKTNSALRAQKNVSRAGRGSGWLGDVIFGASLGPVFSVCSPTYALIVAVILPQSPATGLVYLISYLIGLLGMLGLIAILGRAIIDKLKWSLNPHGAFRKGVGLVLVLFGLLIATGIDKSISAWLLEQGLFDWQIQIEDWLTGLQS